MALVIYQWSVLGMLMIMNHGLLPGIIGTRTWFSPVSVVFLLVSIRSYCKQEAMIYK